MFIIGITGHAEAGKTTFAIMLREELELKGKRTLLINYGDFVKFIAKKYYFWNGEKDEGGRTLLQHIGTQQGRNKVSENIWVDMVINTVKVAQEDYQVAIIADCRFPNEFNRWESYGYNIEKVKIERPNHENKLTPEQRLHPSETSLDDYNDIIRVVNSGDLDELKLVAKAFVDNIINKI